MRSWCKNTARSGQSTKSCPFKIPSDLLSPEQVSLRHRQPSHGVWLFCHIRKFAHRGKLPHSKDLQHPPLDTRADNSCGCDLQRDRTPQRRPGQSANSACACGNGNRLPPHRPRRLRHRSQRTQRGPRQLRHQFDEKGVLISTTEHLLSAFTGVGIDNAIVELDNLELPILDGSAVRLSR